MSALPNIDDAGQLAEFAAAADQPALSPAQLQHVAALAENNFGVTEPPMAYKGTMQRAGV